MCGHTMIDIQATWIAEHRDVDDTVDIFAVFEGDGRYYRQATCSGECGDTAIFAVFEGDGRYYRQATCSST